MKAADGTADIEADARDDQQVVFPQAGPQPDQSAQAAAGAGAEEEGQVDAQSGDGSESDGGKESYSSSGECATGSQAGSGRADKKLTSSVEHESRPAVAPGASAPGGAGAAINQEGAAGAATNGSPEQLATDGEGARGDGDGAGGEGGEGKSEDDRAKPKLPRPEGSMACPRCGSEDTKFCYYNNYNVKQPRYFCKACQRYWTVGGMLRNVPIGAGKRKNKVGRDRHHSVPVLHATPPAGGSGATPPSPQLPASHPLAPLDPFTQLIKQLPGTPPTTTPPTLPPHFAQSLRHILQSNPNPILQFQALTAAATATPPPGPLPQAPATTPFSQTAFSSLNALLTQLSQASRTLPAAQQEALNDPAAAVAAAVAAATAAGLPANTLLDPRFVSQLQQQASAAAVAAPGPAFSTPNPTPSSPRATRANPKQPRSPSASHQTEDGSTPDGRRTRLRSLSPPPARPSGFAPYSANSAPSTLPPSTAANAPKFGQPMPPAAAAAPAALTPPTSAPPITDPNAAALYEGIVKGLWNASLAGHLPPPTPAAPQPPPASCPPLLSAASLTPLDTLSALAATTPNPNNWLSALLTASKQQAAQQAALTAVVQAAVAQQQQQQVPPPPPQPQQAPPAMHLPPHLPGGAAALQHALQAQAVQAAAFQASLGGWQGVPSLPTNSGTSSSSSSFWPGLWPPPAAPQMPANFPPLAPAPQAGGMPSFLAALDAQRVLAQFYPSDPSAAAAVAAAVQQQQQQQHPAANTAAAALAANALLTATQQHHHQHHHSLPPQPPPQQPPLQPPTLQQNPTHWLAAAAAAADSGQAAPPQGISWPMPTPHLSLATPPGWVPTDGGAGPSGTGPFVSWPGPSGVLTQAQAAAVMAAAAGQSLDPAFQAQVTGMLSHGLGSAGSAFRAVGHGCVGGGVLGANGNISGLSNGSGTSTATVLVQQPKHAQSFDSAQ